MLLDEYLLQDEVYWVGFGIAGDIRCLKLLPGTSKSTLLEGGICQVYQEKTFFWGEPIITDLVAAHGVCVNDRTTKA